jgi:mannobiose 2-epimerase
MIPAVYKQEMETELGSILDYWAQNTLDRQEGGFFGQIDGENRIHPDASKGVVQNSRILWAFSAAYSHTHSLPYLAIARRAYEYLLAHFIDHDHGGVYWSVDHTGTMLNGRKQIYGLAFCIYGLSEYYLAAGDKTALDHAVSLFHLIERHSFDKLRKGYYEAFTRDWQPLEDLRLSPKDANEKKTMNTHLHVIEAYANLCRVWPDTLLKQQMASLLEVFDLHIIDHDTGHLKLFFDETWSPHSPLLSYGHDVEAAWLLQESASILGDGKWLSATRSWALKIARAAAEGLDSDGGLWYEKEDGRLVKEKHSWPQAEAMIGFLNAYQLSGEKEWLDRSVAAWEFVKKYIKDPLYGEWHWGVQQDHSPMPGQDKAGFWKCPYHNSRACIEIIKRLQKHPV